jgi:hypothetical protein
MENCFTGERERNVPKYLFERLPTTNVFLVKDEWRFIAWEQV